MLRKILLRQLEPQEVRKFLKEPEQKYPENERQECHGKLFAKSLEKKELHQPMILIMKVIRLLILGQTTTQIFDRQHISFNEMTIPF
jgi:hypothetical protein